MYILLVADDLQKVRLGAGIKKRKVSHDFYSNWFKCIKCTYPVMRIFFELFGIFLFSDEKMLNLLRLLWQNHANQKLLCVSVFTLQLCVTNVKMISCKREWVKGKWKWRHIDGVRKRNRFKGGVISKSRCIQFQFGTLIQIQNSMEQNLLNHVKQFFFVFSENEESDLLCEYLANILQPLLKNLISEKAKLVPFESFKFPRKASLLPIYCANFYFVLVKRKTCMRCEEIVQ